MQWGRLFAAIAAVPCLGLLLLLAGGAPPIGTLAALIATLAATGLAILFWRGELARLARPDGPPPRLDALATLARRWARERAAAGQARERERQTDTMIVERLPDPLIVLGRDRAVQRANAAARRAFGADLAAVLRHPTLRGALDLAERTAEPQHADISLPVPVARDLHATVIDLGEGGEAAASAARMVVLGDRTRERAVERMREDFVANASHELRTPLASLIGFIETLRGPAADDRPAQQRFLAIMAEQAARMNRLIDDLLSLSRIELTEHLPPSETVSLGSLLPRLVAAFEPRLATRRMTLDLAIAEDLPGIVADADQLAQVLQNLLDNAFKYGRDGARIRLAAGLPQGGQWPRRAGVVLAVTDQGQGIAKPHLARLTERFYRVDKGRSRSAGGTGLGLAIVKHIVNRHRGQLLIESVEGCGSTFSVWLPLAP